jgi:hypothetical protein
MAGPVQRCLVRLGVVAALAFFALAIAPATAAACTEEDPQGPGQLDVCRVSFSTPYPTANGQTVTDYAILKIPKEAGGLTPTLSFDPPPSAASRSTQSFELNPTSKNPDNSDPPSSTPNEDVIRQVWTWTGNGASSPASGTVTFAVGFEEQVKPLKVHLSAIGSDGRPITTVGPGQHFSYLVTVFNPNDDPVRGSVLEDEGVGLVHLGDFKIVRRKESGGVGSACMGSINCGFFLAAGGSGELKVEGFYPPGDAGKIEKVFAGANGHQISDGQEADSNSAENQLGVGAPCTVLRGSFLLSRPVLLGCTFGKTPDVALGGPGKVPVGGGAVSLPVKNGNPFKLTGTLSLTSPGALRTARLARPVTIASKHFRAPPGGKVRVKLKLSRAARQALARKHALRVTETARVKDPAGHKRTVSRRLKLVG